jgi:hypothetical protein
MQLQEYPLQIKHISGNQNFFADILSRNPADLTPELRKLNSKQKVLVAKVDLKIDKGILKTFERITKITRKGSQLEEE